MLKIGDFSKLSRVSIRMLRHYDELGLLTPAMTDQFTSYRYYGEDQLPVAAKINALKDMGFGLAAIGEILKCGDDPAVLTSYLNLKQAELHEQASETARQLGLLRTAIERLRKGRITMSYEVVLKELPARNVISVRQVIPGYAQEGMLWQIMMSETAQMRIQYDDPCYASAVFHDKEYKENDVDVEVQMTVKGTYPDTANVKCKTEPAALIASATFKGSYEQMGAVNEAVAAWVRDNGYAWNGAMFNIYHVSPYETKNADEYVTEVCYPVAKA